MVVLMHVFGDRPFVDHYSWSPPLTQEINRPVCNAATKALSICLPALKIFQFHVNYMYVTVNCITLLLGAIVLIGMKYEL